MSTCTPVYQLPYPIGSDRPCDIGETLCSFAASVEAELDRLDGIVDRAVDTVPMASVRMTQQVSYVITVAQNFSVSLPFDSVDVDTADMVNLESNPYLVTLPRTGVYMTSFTIRVDGSLSGDRYGASVSNTNIADNAIGTGTNVYLNGTSLLFYNTTGTAIDLNTPQLTLDISSNLNPQTVRFGAAEMNVIWLRDLP